MQNFCFFPLRSERKVSHRYLQLQFRVTREVAIEEREQWSRPGRHSLMFSPCGDRGNEWSHSSPWRW